MWKKFVSSYLGFTKKDRRGALVVLSLILIFISLPFFYGYFIHKKTYSHSEFEKEIASLKVKQIDSTNNVTRKNYDENDNQHYREPSEKNYYSKEQPKGELFYFDPNTLDEAGWQKLGVKDKTIVTIKNYTSKGGKFYKPEDIRKIWGLSDAEKERLEPYIKIETVAKENNYPQKEYEKTTTEKPKYTPTIVDVNTGDTTAFIALPFIGSKLAQRIITFREKLGGFYKVEQVGETFGLPDSTFQKIKSRLVLSNPAIKQLNINTATLDELKAHPYIRFAVGNAIVQYRSQHGNFASVMDLKKIVAVTDEVYDKVLPYLKIN